MPGQRWAAVAMIAASVALSTTACSGDKPTSAPTCPPGNPAPSRTVPWSSIYANVYNASETRGEGAVVAKRLQWRGLHTMDIANDPLADDRPVPKYAEIRYGSAGRTIALNVAKQIPHANLFEDDRKNPTIDIVIGDKFALTPQPPRPIKDVTVQVFNTTFQAGLASVVSTQLTKQGFHSSAMPNDRAYYPNDVAVIVYDEEGLPDAQRLQMSIPGSRLLQDTQTKGNVDLSGRGVRLYLGSKWLDSGKVATPSQASPSATTKPGC